MIAGQHSAVAGFWIRWLASTRRLYVEQLRPPCLQQLGIPPTAVCQPVDFHRQIRHATHFRVDSPLPPFF